MKKIAYYPGSFDPLTLGHMDILCQALKFVDEFVVGVGIHPDKKPMFDFEQRAEFIRCAVDRIGVREKVRVEMFESLAIDAARNAGAGFLVRGVRDGSDLNYELQLCCMNNAMAPEINTVFFVSSPKNRLISATLVRQIIAMGGDASMFLPETVLESLKNDSQ